DFDAVRSQGPANFVAIGVTLGGTFQIEQSSVPGRNLHAFVAERRRPARDCIQVVERRGIAGKLREKDSWASDCSHGQDFIILSFRTQRILKVFNNKKNQSVAGLAELLSRK